ASGGSRARCRRGERDRGSSNPRCLRAGAPRAATPPPRPRSRHGAGRKRGSRGWRARRRRGGSEAWSGWGADGPRRLLGLRFDRRLLFRALDHGEDELVVARLLNVEARATERLPQAVQPGLLDEEPLPLSRTVHEIGERCGRRAGAADLAHGVARVERLAAPVHLVGRDGLVGRALVVVLPEEIALRPV